MSKKSDGKRWLKEALKPVRPAFRDVAAISLFVNILALSVPVFVLQVYDRVVFYSGLSTLQGLVIGMAIAIAFDFTLRQTRARLLQRVALRIDVAVGRKLFDKLVSLPLRVLEERPFTYWQRLFRDMELVRNTYSGTSAILIFDLPFAVIFVAFIFVIAAPIAWVLAALLPIFILIAWRSTRVLDQANQTERHAAMSRDGLITELLAGRTTVKALALEDAMRPTWEAQHAEAIEASLGRGKPSDTYVNLGIGLTVFTTVILTAVGALAIIDQRLSIGALIAANLLSMRIVQPFQQLVATWRTYSAAREATKRLGAVFALEEDLRDSAVRLERPKGEITVDNVSFGYHDEQVAAVQEIRLILPSGGLHAIVGPNGSGKTTLLKLMQGLYRPTEGRVMLDGADLEQFSRRDLVNWMGYVPQDSTLFAGTIRENIALRHPDASDDDIIAAAKMADVHGFILDLPDGYGTDIGEAGSRLSNGIRQRIAIARALVGDPPVLLLDEPTSHLDRQAEEALAGTLRTLSANHTVVLVTHSPLLLSVAKTIVGLERGRLAIAGPAGEVLPRLFPRRDGQAPVRQPA